MLRLMLDSHSQISCGPETRFLEDLERIYRVMTEPDGSPVGEPSLDS